MKKGFTLIEVLLVMGLFAILAGLVSMNLLRPQTQASLEGTVQTIIADVKSQQLKAMSGDSEGQAAAQQYGVHFETSSYTLFQSSSYVPGDPANFVVSADNLQLTTTFPLAQIVFARRSGEITGFVAGSTGITILNTQSGQQKTITLNRFGVIDSIN